eukprot:GHVT01047786.1.p1 GENE.GHVT01047786.1~~GHVT01047786.1.p1  ORF type:complete len:115 (+),score=20.71 GHVT01047786.1:276-620(+)
MQSVTFSHGSGSNLRGQQDAEPAGDLVGVGSAFPTSYALPIKVGGALAAASIFVLLTSVALTSITKKSPQVAPQTWSAAIAPATARPSCAHATCLCGRFFPTAARSCSGRSGRP